MTILRVILFWMLAIEVGTAATWKSDATPVTLTGMNIQHSAGIAVIRSSDNTWWSSGSYTPSGNWVNGAEKVISSRQLAFDFYVVVYSAPSGLWTRVSEGKMHRWISAYEIGGNEPQTSTNGPYGPGGPTNDDGEPVDPTVGGPPTTSYKAQVTVSCPADSLNTKSFLITGRAGTSVIYQQVVTIIPGESRTITVTNETPFTLSAQEVIPKMSRPDPEISGNESDPDKPEDWKPIGPENTVNSAGQTAPPPSDGVPEATNEKTAQNGTNAKPAAQNETRPGTPEGNADARNQELRNELQRLTDQVKTSGDSTKSGIDETNRELKKLNGGSSGGASGTGANFGAPSDAAMGFAGSIGSKAAGLGSALGNLLGAAGLGANTPGSNALTWQVPVMGDTVTVSVEDHSAVFLGVRSAVLWVASAFFIWRVFSIMRGAFADEGK